MCQASALRVATIELGGIRVHQLYDGAVEHAPAHRFFGVNVDDALFQSVSNKHSLETGNFVFPATVALIEVKGRRILIDAGHGTDRYPSAGQLFQSLNEACIHPLSIDTVILSHMHCDHIGGLLDAQGQPVFKKAKHLVQQVERDYWLYERADCEAGRMARRVIDALGGRVQCVGFNESIAEGVTLMDAAGHTPGNMCVHVKGDREQLVVAGDLANHPVWSIAHPDWHMSLDWDGQMAAQTRARVLGQIADEGLLMSGYHMPFPAVGRIARSGGSFRYVPVMETVSAV